MSQTSVFTCRAQAVWLLFVLASSAGCSSQSSVGADRTALVDGDFTVGLANGVNGCAFPSWEMAAPAGSTASTGYPNILLHLTHSGSAGTDVTAEIGGLAALFFASVTATSKLTGGIDGKQLHLSAFGTLSHQKGNCSFTYNALCDATLDGDAMSGTVRYVAATNGNPDCASVACTSEQRLTGVRNPK